MKSIKKFFALLLSIIMLLSTFVIPTTADETESDPLVTKVYSLLDLTRTQVGEKITGDSSALPSGLSEAGVGRYNFNLWDNPGQLTFHDGTQEIVEIDGEKLLKVYFDKQSSQLNDLYGAKGVYSIKMPVPNGLGAYVTEIGVDFENHATGTLKYRLGGLGNGKCASASIYPYNTGVGGTIELSYLKEYTNITDATNRSSKGASTVDWDNVTNPLEEIYFLMTDQGATADGMDGYVLLRDITVTVVAPESVVLLIEKNFNMLDFSKADVGDFSVSQYPVGVSEMAFDTPQHTGAKKIVENYKGNKVLQIDLNDFTWDSSCGGKYERIYSAGQAAGYNEAYSIKLTDIPEQYIPYITKINLKLRKSEDSDARIAFEFGVTDGTKYSRVDQYANQYVWNKGTNSFNYNPDNLHNVEKWKVQQWSSTINSAPGWDDTFTGLFLTLTAYTEEGGNPGTLEIEEISYTCVATEAVWRTLPTSRTYNLLDMSDADEGLIEDSQYPVGVKEIELMTNDTDGIETTYKEAGGTKSVVTNADGKKVLRLNLDSVNFTRANTQNKFFDGGYSPIYTIKLTDIPTTYIPLIDKINLVMKKTDGSTAHIIYEFGVTDDNMYSKNLRGENGIIVSTDKSAVIEYNPNDLKKIDSWNVGYTISESKWDEYVNWNKDFTSLFLTVSAFADDATTIGALDIEEISYTCTATENQFTDADAEWDVIKYKIEDFEDETTGVNGVIETSAAPGGVKAIKYNSNSKNTLEISNNYIEKADGISFWVYNPSDSAQDFKFRLGTADSSVAYVHACNETIPANSYRKIEFDFSCIAKDPNPLDGTTWLMGDDVNLNTLQRRAIDRIYITARTDDAAGFYIDDIYLFDNDNIKTREYSDITWNSGSVNGATVNESGKIVIPASANMQTVAITIPKGTLTNAYSLKYNLTSNSSTAANLRFYTNAILDDNRGEEGGKPAFIKAGANPWQYSVSADATLTQKMYLGGIGQNWGNEKYNEYVGIFPQTDTANFDSWTYQNLPTASEKATTDTIYIDVASFGNPENKDTDYITLDSINLFSLGAAINVVDADGCTIMTPKAPLRYNGAGDELISSKANEDAREFVGETAEIYVSVNKGFTLAGFNAVDSTGTKIVINKANATDGTNLGTLYTFTVPTADVTITPIIAITADTFISSSDYNGDDVDLSYTTQVANGKVYNENTKSFENLENCGVIVVADAALKKYGYTQSDLTRENVAKWIETGHNLANYVCTLTEKDLADDLNGVGTMDYTIKVTDVSLSVRRNGNIHVVEYANFTDDNGNASAPVEHSINASLDRIVYGDKFKPEFCADRGVNYTYYSCTDPAYMQELSDIGFDHIRLALRMSWGGLDSNGMPTKAYLEQTDKQIKNALRAGLSVVVDLHNLVDLNTNYSANVQKYRDVWDILAKRYAAYPESVIFELINEPVTEYTASSTIPDPMTPARLNSLQIELINNIRAIEGNENRKMIIAKNWNDAWNLEVLSESLLKMPNLIIDFHFYSPMDFTHSGQGSRPEGTTWDGSTSVMTQKLGEMAALGNKYGIGIWIGEWGAYKCDYNDKLEYYASMVSTMQNYGISWAVWASTDYWSGYIPETDSWDQQLLDIMFKKY